MHAVVYGVLGWAGLLAWPIDMDVSRSFLSLRFSSIWHPTDAAAVDRRPQIHQRQPPPPQGLALKTGFSLSLYVCAVCRPMYNTVAVVAPLEQQRFPPTRLFFLFSFIEFLLDMHI